MGKFFLRKVLVFLLNVNLLQSLQPVPTAGSSSSEEEKQLRTIDFNHERCQTVGLREHTLESDHFYSTENFHGENGALELLVRFKGRANGQVVLSQSANLSEPLYTVIMGSYNNRVSEIRRGLENGSVFKINTPEILSGVQFRGFVIRYNENNGELWVYSEGSYMPLLHWKDLEPLKIRYFSFLLNPQYMIEVAFNCKPKDLHSLVFQHKSG